ncbi:hypothetical protein B0H16DRAFT_1760115 [Mycena metata]|uniref:Uncharacterized protein n=1 Tax=Mycena metata TaxID=1033252 RepID=A0AAD7JYZ0_9AGAR|nr:hypothetical protein B0H16DRAFT_1760115 [Mycena metata]
MASIWPAKLDSLSRTLHFLEMNTTASLANSEFAVDLIPPGLALSGSYNDINGKASLFWVFGQVTSNVKSEDGRMVFKLGGGTTKESIAFFRRQLHALALPVKADDDDDTDHNRNMQAEPVTDGDRINLTSGTFIQIQVAESMGQRARVYIPGGPDLFRQRDAWYPGDFSFKVDDWVLVYATLFRGEDLEKKKRSYRVIAQDVRRLWFESAGEATARVINDPGTDSKHEESGRAKPAELVKKTDQVEVGATSLELNTLDEHVADDATLSSSSSVGEDPAPTIAAIEGVSATELHDELGMLHVRGVEMAAGSLN